MRACTCIAVLFVFCGVTALDAQMLVQNRLWTQPPEYVLDKQFANVHWDVDLFCSAANGSISYMKHMGGQTENKFAVIADPCWNRLIYATDNYGEVRSYGTPGTGAGQFRQPQSVVVSAPIDEFHQANSYYNIYVADTGNNRIQRLTYSWQTPATGLVHAQYMVASFLVRPIDIALDNNSDYWPDANDAVWAACENNTIVRMPVAGGAAILYGSPGNGTGQFNGISAIACGHNPVTWANDNTVYVADTGNFRIVKLLRTGNSLTWLTSVWHGAGNLITDLETDVEGHLYATTSNGYVLKFTPDLVELGIMGSPGVGDNQFSHPSCVSNSGGYLGSGGVLFTEDWTNQTGIKGYTIGTDISNLSANSNWVSSHCEFTFYFSLADYSWIWVEVRRTNGTLVKQLKSNVLTISGLNAIAWNGKDQQGAYIPSGTYRFIVRAESNYKLEGTNEVSAIVTDTLQFSTCNPPCTWLVGDANGSGGYSISDCVKIINYIFAGGSPPTPHPVGSGDANCSHAVSISDAVFLKAHIFESGPPPPCTCSDYQ